MNQSDIEFLRLAWVDQSWTKTKICKTLRISYKKLCRLQVELSLGVRDVELDLDRPGDPDPTPEEIAAMTAAMRATWPDWRLANRHDSVDYSRTWNLRSVS